MAENICFFIRTFLIASSILILFGKATVDVNQCGSLKIEQPTILGKNVTFTFTPETTSDADLKWQRTNKRNPWSTLPTDNKFTQYFQDGTYYLILTNTVRRDDEVVYRVDYKNKSVNCLMETKKLQLQVIASNQCGFVYLRTTNLKEGENVEIEYYPSEYVMKYPERYVRQWKYSTQNSTFSVRLTKDVYEEEKEPNNKYMLTITMFNEQKNGRYGVYCGKTGSFTNMVEVILPVAPSAPAFEGLKEDTDDCKGCIVGEDGDQFSVLCKTSGGTQPITVNMSIGNEEQSPKRYDKIAGYMAFFILRTRHHMAIMTCTVMNDALTSPLIITARVYVIKSPTLKLLVPQILKEGSIGNITCIVDGGRPAPNAILNISGMEVPSAVQIDSLNATTSLYTSIVSLSTFERTWNSENVACCRFNEWYKIRSACSSPKRFNIMFPPSTINLEVKVEQKRPFEIYAVCTIYNSNPACGVDISASNGVIVSERYTNNVSQPHGAWDSEHAVNLNVDKDDNGTKIECSADCQNFAVNLNDARSIVLPYAPTIEFNISGSVHTILQGEQAHVKCSAQSIPASNISWVEQSDVGNITMKQCQLQADCVIAVEANLTQQRKFICQTHYLQTSNQKTLTVNILDEKRSKDLDNSASGDNLFIWIILGSCLAVLFVVVIVCLIARKKMRNTKAKLEANQMRFSANPDKVSRNKEDKLERHPHGNLNDGAHGFDDSEVKYSQPVKDKALSNADATYSEVNKTGQSNSSASCPQNTQQDGQLLYADLGFDPNDAPLKGAAAKRRNSPTEYVDIDFVKTAAEQAKNNESTEADNIYANQ